MKKAFTLVELLVVVVVISALMAIVFKLGSAGEDSRARNETINRLQRLENCISGYYAAFGSYPPVRLHGSRNIFYKVNGYGIQQTERKEIDESEIVWKRVEAACRSQPLGMNFPFPSYMKEYVKAVSRALKELHDTAGANSEYAKNPNLANLFDGLEELSSLRSSSGSYEDWGHCQLFQFGLMSYLLPRYLVMMGHQEESGSIYDGFVQWSKNNQLPCRFEDGSHYGSWEELNDDVISSADGAQNANAWKVEAMASQAVTTRWLPNLKGILNCEKDLTIYGIKVSRSDDNWSRNVDVHNPYPRLYSVGGGQSGANSSAGSSQQYALDGVTCKDGWNNEFYYYSAPPYQSYRLWSAGPNGKTFPPWIPPEEFEKMKVKYDNKMWYGEDPNRKSINLEAVLADDIVHMSN